MPRGQDTKDEGYVKQSTRNLTLPAPGQTCDRSSFPAESSGPTLGQNPLDLTPRGQVYRVDMGRLGLLIGEVAAQSGVSRKALRLYEAAGILPPPTRTAAGYRVYGKETLAILAFVIQARRLGLGLEEIKEIVAIRRSGQLPCSHVRQLVHRKVADLDRTIRDLASVRNALRDLLASWSRRRGRIAAVCPHIEHGKKGR